MQGDNILKSGDIVLKEKMKGQTKKGGKLNDQYNASTYTLVNITKNGNCVLMSNKGKKVLKTHCLLSQVKKCRKRQILVNDISLDERMEAVDSMDNSVDKTTQGKMTTDIRMEVLIAKSLSLTLKHLVIIQMKEWIVLRQKESCLLTHNS